MAALFYAFCQNTYKNIFYISNFGKINKRSVEYFVKQFFISTNNKNVINSSSVKNIYFLTSVQTTKPTQLFQVCLFTHQNKLLKYVQGARTFSSSTPERPDPPKRSLPQLMEFPEIVWPSIFKSIRNWILSTLIIAPYFDREFSLYDFVTGSKMAVEVVSHKLSSGNFKELEGLVTQDALEVLQKSLSKLTLAQRQQLAIDRRDIYFSFPYQVGVMFEDENEKVQKRFVEITMVYHVLQGLHLMRERGEEPPLNVGMAPEFREKIHICNYRFIREFTKGVEDQWTVNLINHFKPSDFV